MVSEMNPELEALRQENQLLRDLVRTHEVDRDTNEYYERILDRIAKSIGCNHIDDRLPSCVETVALEHDVMLNWLKQIVRRNGITPQGVGIIEKWLKAKEFGEVVRQA